MLFNSTFDEVKSTAMSMQEPMTSPLSCAWLVMVIISLCVIVVVTLSLCYWYKKGSLDAFSPSLLLTIVFIAARPGLQTSTPITCKCQSFVNNFKICKLLSLANENLVAATEPNNVHLLSFLCSG